MSQEYSNTRKSRRARARNRPVLVSGTEAQQDRQAAEETAISVEEPALPATPAPAPPETPNAATPRRRLPSFFSTVGKKETSQDGATKEVDVAQARLARATRGKVPATKAEQPAKPAPAKAVPSTRASSATRPTSTFKTRYILGMGIYLLSANFIGVLETQFLVSNHLESVLGKFNLLGLPVIVRTSTLVFLVTLILILVLLAWLDLIPRNLSAAAGGSTAQRRTMSQRETSSGERVPPPVMRQGVKGADDDLYQQYRANQRREKKR